MQPMPAATTPIPRSRKLAQRSRVSSSLNAPSQFSIGRPMNTTYHVSGMTCQHCVRAVTEELSALNGVNDVHVDLIEGGISPVHVETDRQLDRDAVADAVDEAGYELVEA